MSEEPRPDPLRILDLAQTRAAAVIAAVRGDQLHLPTPCHEWDVADVINKLIASTVLFTAFGARTDPPEGLDLINPRPMFDDDPLGVYLDEAARCRQAWRRPGALEGTAPSTIGEAPAKAVLHARIFDTTVLSTDISRACGLEHGIDAEQARYVLRIARALVPAVRSASPARYRDSIEVADADPVTELLAVTGRDPAWTPASS